MIKTFNLFNYFLLKFFNTVFNFKQLHCIICGAIKHKIIFVQNKIKMNLMKNGTFLVLFNDKIIISEQMNILYNFKLHQVSLKTRLT